MIWALAGADPLVVYGLPIGDDGIIPVWYNYVVLPRRLQESIAAADRGELQEHALVEVQ